MQQPTRAFLVTDTLRGPSPLQLSTVEWAFDLACQRLNSSGTPIQLVATRYLTTQQRWLGLLLADSLEDVRRAAATAQLAGVSVVEL